MNCKFFYNLIVILMISCCFFLSSCQKETTHTEVATQEKPTPTPMPRTEEVIVRGDCNPCLIKVTPKASEEASLGQEYTGEVEVLGLENAGDVVVHARVPQGVTFVKSEPPAEMADGRLTWKFDTIKKGGAEKIQLWFKADKEGEHVCCFSYVARPMYCVMTKVGKPEIGITKEGPAVALLNQEITYKIVVRNAGNAPANNVVVTDTIPEGLKHASGQNTVTFDAGTLAAGESKAFDLTVTTTQVGRFVNVAKVTTSNAGSASAEAPTEVKSQMFDVNVTCSQKEFLRNKSNNNIVIHNTGQTVLSGIKVVATTDGQVTILDDRFAEGRVEWDVENLEAGQKKEIAFRATSGVAGKHCIKVMVTTSEGLSKEAECCTEWEGIPAMLLETVDDPDPVKIGDDTIYTITVTNQGTKEDTKIHITAVFPQEVDPVEANGPDGLKAIINGKEVTFEGYERLEPKQKIVYTIKGRGKSEGDSRLKVYLRSAFLSERGKPPVTEEESTNVY